MAWFILFLIKHCFEPITFIFAEKSIFKSFFVVIHNLLVAEILFYFFHFTVIHNLISLQTHKNNLTF